MFEHSEIQLGIAPINWTSDNLPVLGEENTFEQMISEAALAGFSGTEIGRKFPGDSAALRRALRLRGISLAARWFPAFLSVKSYRENEAAFLKDLDFLGTVRAKYVTVCEMGGEIWTGEQSAYHDKPYLSDKQWSAFCEGLNHLGRLAATRGIRLCVHHHIGTVVQSIAEIRRLLAQTDARYVSLCYDTGHFALADEDAVQAAREFGPRVAHVHLADIRAAILEQARAQGYSFRKSIAAGCFTVPGDGCLEFEKIFQALDQAGYSGWLIVEAEQNPLQANPFEYALKAKHYLKAMLALELEPRV